MATVALLALWFVALSPNQIGGPVGLIWVSGVSMEPTLHTGDLSILYRSEHYEVGDIVAFDIPEGGTVIHRVSQVVPGGYRFQGDNREQEDPWVLDESAIRGRQVYAVSDMTGAMDSVGRPPIMAALTVALVVLVAMRHRLVPADGARRTRAGAVGPAGPDVEGARRPTPTRQPVRLPRRRQPDPRPSDTCRIDPDPTVRLARHRPSEPGVPGEAKRRLLETSPH